MRAYLRSLDPGLSRPLWTLLSGSLANAFGNGVVFPFLLIYLHNVRGIGLGTAGLVLAASSVAGLVAGPGGRNADRPPRAAARAASRSIVALCCRLRRFRVRRTPPARRSSPAPLAGLGNGSFWPSHAGMVAALTERTSRHNAYAMQRVLNNLGIGLGGVVGGLIATTAHPRTYRAAVRDRRAHVRRLPGRVAVRPRAAAAHRAADAPRRGYGQVLRHKTFVAYVVMNACLVALGFSSAR